MDLKKSALNFWPVSLIFILAAMPLFPIKDYLVVVNLAFVILALCLNISQYRTKGSGNWSYVISSFYGLLAITLLIFEKIGVANLGLTIMQSICQAGAVGYIIMGWFGKKSIKA